jgi:exopolyphosphatase/guanosine-5'-triphosphate,3'-diphosphate pyrophosphatase
MRVGVLDIGSNSVLLLVGEYTGTNWRILTDQTRITRLGEGFGATRELQLEAITRTLQAVEEYLAECRVLQVGHIVAAATAVVREATNPEAILQPLRERLPESAEMRVLSPQDEARLSYQSVALDETLGVGAERLAVLDIGGGSVEVALGQGVQVQAWCSFPVGAGRVREAHMPSDPPSPREVLAATRALDEAFAPLRELPQPDRVVAIGGTGVNLAMLALGLTAFDPAQVHGVWFGDETPAALLERLLRLSDAERRALPGIEPDRAALLHVGALILERALFALRREEVQISTRGLRYGILYELRENSLPTPE